MRHCSKTGAAQSSHLRPQGGAQDSQTAESARHKGGCSGGKEWEICGSAPRVSEHSRLFRGTLNSLMTLPSFFINCVLQVFVCGSYPHWLVFTQQGALRLHPMFIDGPISSFTSFHNVNCPHGFLYFSAEGELRICLLPSHLSYDSPWPTRKVPTRCTPHFISYHMESKTHALITSEQEPGKQIPIGEIPEELETVDRGKLKDIRRHTTVS